jgi:hypothetical protein
LTILTIPQAKLAAILFIKDIYMKDVSFYLCVEFQDCFLFDDHFSPFEHVGDFRKYYPRVLLGEIGCLINASCKQPRSANLYDEEIKDECTDLFIYLLLFGRMLKIHKQIDVFGLIQKRWNDRIDGSISEDDFYNKCRGLMKKVDRFLDPEAEGLYNERYFYEIFLSIQQISRYQTGLDWQQVVNDFHRQVLVTHMDPKNITLDGWYKGVSRLDFGKLLGFIEKVDVNLPPKRIQFLERIAILHGQFGHPFPLSKNVSA